MPRGALSASEQYGDVTLGDLRVATDFLLNYRLSDGKREQNKKEAKEALEKERNKTKVKKPQGVCIWRDAKLYIEEKLGLQLVRYEEFRVHPEHGIYSGKEPTSISYQLEIPILLVIEPHTLIDYVGGPAPVVNEAATSLTVVADPENTSFRSAPAKWCSPGNVLVDRQDKKDITKEQVQALVEFCKGPVMDLVEKWKKGMYFVRL
jgi:hypothetical protein